MIRLNLFFFIEHVLNKCHQWWKTFIKCAIQIYWLDLQITLVALSMWLRSLSWSCEAFLLIILLLKCTQEGNWLTEFIYISFQSAWFISALFCTLKEHNCRHKTSAPLLNACHLYSKYCKWKLTSVTSTLRNCPVNLQRSPSPHY